MTRIWATSYLLTCVCSSWKVWREIKARRLASCICWDLPELPNQGRPVCKLQEVWWPGNASWRCSWSRSAHRRKECTKFGTQACKGKLFLNQYKFFGGEYYSGIRMYRLVLLERIWRYRTESCYSRQGDQRSESFKEISLLLVTLFFSTNLSNYPPWKQPVRGDQAFTDFKYTTDVLLRSLKSPRHLVLF